MAKKTLICLLLCLFISACNNNPVPDESTSETEDQTGIFTQTQQVSLPNNNTSDNDQVPLQMLPTITPQNRHGEITWTYRFFPINISSHYGYDIRQFFPYNFFQSRSEPYFYYPLGYAYDSNNIYFPSDRANIIAVDMQGGNMVWKSDLQGFVLGVSENTVFVLTGDSRIYGLDKETGREKWTIYLDLLVEEDDYYSYYPQLIQSNRRNTLPIQTSCPDGNSLRFLHIDENTGENELTPCNSEIDESVTPLIVFKDQIFAADQSFYSINLKDGSVNWTIDSPWKASSSFDNLNILDFDVEKGILYYYVGSIFLTDIYAIDIRTGNFIWVDGLGKQNGISSEDLSGRVYSLEKFIVVDSSIGFVYVFNKENGKLINKIDAPRKHDILVAENGAILDYYDVGILVGVDYVGGVELWSDDEIEIDNNLRYLSYEDILIVPDSHQDLMAIDQRTGNKLWIKDISKNEKFGFENEYLVYFNKEKLEFINIFNGTTREIFLDNLGSASVDGGHIEKITDSSWIVCGDYLIMVQVK